ncbi:hypothetical protein KC960_00515 [Candidatus Saccharibacteria bacterium]|nr:hypothetical protein [Candidatus Saccharibacteria bacterium]
MHKKQKTNINIHITRLTRTIYFFIVIFAISIIIFDSGNLITKESVIQRWSILTVLTFFNTLAWYMGAHYPKRSRSFSTFVLSLVLVLFTGFLTYWERGMASTSTILYAIPMLVVATLKNRHALIAIATTSSAVYSMAAVKYFNDYFNEGYRIQLWGNIILYSGTFFVCAWLIMILAGLREDSK